MEVSVCTQLAAVGLKSDGMTGQTTGHLKVDMPWVTVPSLFMCNGHTAGSASGVFQATGRQDVAKMAFPNSKQLFCVPQCKDNVRHHLFH